ncbi:MAG TPA: hypothetical protein VG406_26165 [Isosphaeraceae bacterium]|nr:hypothetical protein [Isosphaeraceae bacterium]
MRKALFAVVLVAASFAGGAVINGPGLAWARSLLRPKATEVGTLLPPPPNDPPPRPESADDDPDAAPAIPAAPRPPLSIDTPNGPVTRPEAKPKSKSKPTAPPEPLDPKAVADGTTTLEGPAPAVAAGPVNDDPALDPPAIRPVVEDATEGRPDPAVGRAVVHRDEPKVKVTEPATAATAALDWPTLRKRMAELGVSRYWVEGEPGGVARFRCVIPVAGARAVGQQFEAEGDDDLKAADAALKRVALWKATESE